MTTSLLIPAALLIGASIPLQVALNSQLAGATGHPLTASFMAFGIAVLVLGVLCLVIRPEFPTLSAMAAAPKTVWLGGVLAAGYLAAVVTVAPRLGVGLTTALILVGQLVTALAIDHFGAFGAPQQSINVWRVGGLALMVAGVAVVKTH